MDCVQCDGGIDGRTGYFELHHHQSGSDPVRQHVFCCADCLREYLDG